MRLMDIKNLDELKRSQTVVTDKRLVIATCYPENAFNHYRTHKDRRIIGLVCGIKDYWIDIIPELNEDNINTLYGGELVINYLLEKNKGNLFEALKEFKGSEKNIYPVLKSIKIYKELK